MPTLPPLVITGNRIDALGPLNLYGAKLHSFCVPADNGKIQKLLDKTFSAPSGGAVRYEAIGDTVFLSFAEIDRIVVLDELEKNNGSSSEIDAGAPCLVERVCRSINHAREHLDAFQFAKFGRRQNRLDRCAQAFVADLPGKSASEADCQLFERHDLQAMPLVSGGIQSNFAHRQPTMSYDSPPNWFCHR